MDEEEQETRYYALSGQAIVLDRVETVMRFIERAGERGVIRLVSAFVDGKHGARVKVRVLASHCGGGEGAGSGLPHIEDEGLEQAHYVVDVVVPRD